MSSVGVQVSVGIWWTVSIIKETINNRQANFKG
jgi:hypothetical protein